MCSRVERGRAPHQLLICTKSWYLQELPQPDLEHSHVTFSTRVPSILPAANSVGSMDAIGRTGCVSRRPPNHLQLRFRKTQTTTIGVYEHGFLNMEAGRNGFNSVAKEFDLPSRST